MTLWSFRNILRKEVIQPHLPIRLPCYDFTPVIEPAFGSSLPLLGTISYCATYSFLEYSRISSCCHAAHAHQWLGH